MKIIWEQSINPVVVEYWGFQIRYYGLFFAISVLLIYQLLSHDIITNKIKLTRERVTNLIFLTVIGAVVGSRIFYVLFHYTYFFIKGTNWYGIFAIWRGGLSFVGGLLGGTLSFWILCRFYRQKFLVLADFVSPLLFLGQSIGRLGNYFNGDDYGVPTSSGWGVIFRYGPAAVEFPEIPLHPVVLYESFFTLLGFILLYQFRNKGFRPGFIIALYIIFYSAMRFWLSFFWAEELQYFGINLSIYVTVPVFITAAGFIYLQKLYEQPAKKQVREYITNRNWRL